MKLIIFTFSCILVNLMFAESMARGIHWQAPSTLQYYHYTVPVMAHNNVQPKSLEDQPTDAPTMKVKSMYYKYTACVARHFLMKDCTLCFCTDLPNVAVCWDNTDEECDTTKKEVEENANAVNNDPNGIW